MKCQFHPLREANNHCLNCEKYYCHDCSDTAQVERDVEGDASCYVCGQRMQTLILSSDVEPFWHRLNSIYQYPLSSKALITIAVIAVISFLLSDLGLFAILPVAALHLYSFSCLRETAGGQLNAPSVSVCFEQSLAPLFYVVISAVCAQFLTVLAFGTLGTGVGIIVAGFFMMALPAMIILIAIEGSLASSINPSRLMSVMKATGSSYFVMLLFIVVMWSSMALIISLFNELGLPALTAVMQSLITSYYTIIIYHIMGYLVYQNQDTLGHTVESESRALPNTVSQSDKQLAAKFEFMVKLGNFKEAQILRVLGSIKLISHYGSGIEHLDYFVRAHRNRMRLIFLKHTSTR